MLKNNYLHHHTAPCILIVNVACPVKSALEKVRDLLLTGRLLFARQPAIVHDRQFPINLGNNMMVRQASFIYRCTIFSELKKELHIIIYMI